MLAADLRRMASIIPAGWRAVVVMIFTIVLFPLLISGLVLDALTHEMPAVRAPISKLIRWMGSWLHWAIRRIRAFSRHETAYPRLIKAKT